MEKGFKEIIFVFFVFSLCCVVNASITVHFNVGENGSLDPNQTIEEPENVGIHMTATPHTGYVVDKWLIDGTCYQMGHMKSYVCLMGNEAEHTIEIIFKEANINFKDFALVASGFGQADIWVYWPGYYIFGEDLYDIDLNLDNRIDTEDIILLAENWLYPKSNYQIQTEQLLIQSKEKLQNAVNSYMADHGGQIPGNGSLMAEEALTSITDFEGNLLPANFNFEGQSFGPYLHTIPANPYSIFHLGIENLIRTGFLETPFGMDTHHWRLDALTSIIEPDHDINIENELPDHYKTYVKAVRYIESVRDAILKYRSEHNGYWPVNGSANFIECLTGFTDENGEKWIEGQSSGEKLGTYIDEIPLNPRTYWDFSSTKFVRVNGPQAGAWTHQWRYDSNTGKFEYDDSFISEIGVYFHNY